jgi:hypothetical protein
MRAAPAFQVSLRRFGVWQGAVWALVAVGLGSTAAWLATHERPLHMGLPFIAALTAMAVLVLGVSLARTPPADLRWDGLVWYLGARTDEPSPGRLAVAIDLGSWMLLRFVPEPTEIRRPATWLPVQRRGLEADWHGLRCAVFSPRPALAEAGQDASPESAAVRRP